MAQGCVAWKACLEVSFKRGGLKVSQTAAASVLSNVKLPNETMFYLLILMATCLKFSRVSVSGLWG
jgi:hypothetical protein